MKSKRKVSPAQWPYTASSAAGISCPVPSTTVTCSIRLSGMGAPSRKPSKSSVTRIPRAAGSPVGTKGAWTRARLPISASTAFSDIGRTRRVKASPLYCPKAAEGMVFAVCSIVEHSFLQKRRYSPRAASQLSAIWENISGYLASSSVKALR